MNADSAAEKFAKIIEDIELQKELSVKMKERLREYTDFRKYYNETVDFLVNVVNDAV